MWMVAFPVTMAEDRRFNAHNPGCLEGLLNFLALDQRLHMPKMIAYGKQSEGNKPLRIKVPKTKRSAPSVSEEHSCVKKDENTSRESNNSSPTTNLRMFLMRTLMFKKRTAGKEQKKINSSVSSPSSSRLLRSRSIHHSKCFDYVFADESTSNHQRTSVSSSNEPDSCRSAPQLSHRSPSGPCKACGSVGGKSSMDLDVLADDLPGKPSSQIEKLTEEKEVCSQQKGQDAAIHHSKEFLDFLELFNAHRELFLKILHDPSLLVPGERGDQELETFPKLGSSGKRKPLFDRSDSTDQSRNLELQRSSARPIADLEVAKVISTRMAAGADGSPVSLKESRRHKKAATGSNHFRAIRQKIKDVVRENKRELARITNDGLFHRVPYGQKMAEFTKNQCTKKCGKEEKYIPRSYSLTESLDRYSTLFESISRDSKISPERTSFATEVEANLQDRKSPVYLKRIASLPEMRLYSPIRDVKAEVSVPKAHDTEAEQFTFNRFSVCTDGSFYPDDITQRTADVYSEITYEESTFRSLFEGDTSSISSPSLRSFDQSFFQDRMSSFIEHSAADPEPTFEHILLEEDEWLVKPSHTFEDCAVDDEFGHMQRFTEQDNVNSSHIHVNDKNDADFEYVKDILKKSGFSRSEALGEWYATDQPVNPVLFEEAECPSPGRDMVSDITLNHMLLFDLINEVLMDIYDSASVVGPWHSRFDARTRPMPVGSHVLEEVWARMSRYLNLRRETDQAIESVVACDIARNDGWMNLQSGSEYVLLDVEDLILDELLDHAVLQMVRVS